MPRDATSPADRLRRHGLVLAPTAEGGLLPVLDVAHPRFALADDAAGREALAEAVFAADRRDGRLPGFVRRWLLRAAVRRSRLMRTMFAGQGPFLDGLSTYVMKLGPDNLLPPYDSPMDRRFAAAPHVLSLRLRCQQVATLLAEGLGPLLAASPDRPLHLLNIAGGPAIDTLNALFLVHDRSPDLLERPVLVHVLDLRADGVGFGAAALSAATAPGGRLAGRQVELSHTSYDWNDPAALAAIVDAAAAGAVIAASSEGGLFEYGSDAAIAANLAALHARGRGAEIVAGSVTRSAADRRGLSGADRFAVVPRGLAAFAPLAEAGGFGVERSRPTVWSDQVLLRRA